MKWTPIQRGLMAALLAWGVGAIWLGFFPLLDPGHLPFDSAVWKTRKADGDSSMPPRLRMVNDLLARKILNGKPRTQIVALLGEPDQERAGALSFQLGPRSESLNTGARFLDVRLDVNGYVDDTYIWTD